MKVQLSSGKPEKDFNKYTLKRKTHSKFAFKQN